MTLIAALAAAGFAAGVWLIADGLRLRTRDETARAALDPLRFAGLKQRALTATALGLPVAAVTRWPVAAAGLAALGWFARDLFGSRAGHVRETARPEAIAAWTEMLRDTMSGAHGLEQAVMTTAPVAPMAIRHEVAALAVRLERQPLSTALAEFAEDLSHPTADLVVAALTLAAQGSVGHLGELLGILAVAAREEAGMRLRVDATRARLRTAVRVIAACTASTAVGLVLLNRSYLHAYGSITGQVVLATVVVTWGVALSWLARMGEFVAPERFLAVTAQDSGR